MDQTDDSSVRRKTLPMTTDEPGLRGLTPSLQSPASIGLGSLDVDSLVPEEMELQTGASVDEPLQLNACGVVGHCSSNSSMDDLDMNFLSDLLQSNSSRVELLLTNESEDSPPTTDSPSSDAADTSSSTEEPMRATMGTARPKKVKKTLSTSSSSSMSDVAEAEPEHNKEKRVTDRKARRRAQVASSARRL
ncbi:hypothetical protein F443_06094, partial [Phytophthora nicotianae P1569]